MLALIQNGIDWTALIQEATCHEVIPLLYHSLQATCPEAVPEPVLAQLRTFFQANTRRNLSLTGELLALLDLFAAQGIAAIPYKGPLLAAAVYGNLALRTFRDLDMLVHQHDIPAIKSLLLAQGYCWRPHISHLLQARMSLYVRSSYLYDVCFERRDSTGKRLSLVEMHWDTHPRHIFFPLNPEQLWQHLVPFALAGRLVPTLPPEELLPLLCINGAKDHWIWLKALCDVAELVRANPGIEWEKTRHEARILGREKIFLLGLALARELLEVDLPTHVRQWIATEPVVHFMSQQVCQRLLHAPRQHLAPNQRLGSWRKALFNLRLRDSLQDKVRYCWFAIIQQVDQRITTLMLQRKD